ncbi:hypothetical protein B0H14DRAFT_3695136 [Mycena olivaceomarginata]|nr:hypothetical protein B0H14DRAFT_3695136 [Mycena olivaceomarginata]
MTRSMPSSISSISSAKGEEMPLNIIGELQEYSCPAKLLLLIPVDETDLCVVAIPQAGAHHNHPVFPAAKTPFSAAQKYDKCINSAESISAMTLCVDKSSSTKTLLGGKLPQEIHPSLIDDRKRPVWNEFEKDKERDVGDHYIHEVSTQGDMHVIITIDPDLALLAIDATWIMVDTTFAVVHGKMNSWKLLIWLHGNDKYRWITVIGRVWSNRATRDAFFRVWSGIFDAIHTITGFTMNFKVFSKNCSLLGAIGDSEGPQAQGLGDFIILRCLNTPTVNGSSTVDVDGILKVIWKTCLVHFKSADRGVFALETHVEAFVFQILLGFPYLETEAEFDAFKAFCTNSTNAKIKAWWAHKISYPWLLPSLNRFLTSMPTRHWDLMPGDTNPIEGSHAPDNQVNHTNRSLLEAILLHVSSSLDDGNISDHFISAREYDQQTARVLKASAEAGILENGNNSLQARFTASSRRQAGARTKKAELEMRDGGKHLKAKLKAAERREKEKELEIQRLRAQLSAPPVLPSNARQRPQAGPSTRRYRFRYHGQCPPPHCIWEQQSLGLRPWESADVSDPR